MTNSPIKIAAVLLLVVLTAGGSFYYIYTKGARGEGSAAASVSEAASSTSSSLFSETSLGFSFTIPPGFHAQKMLDDRGETILVQSKDDKSGFQVYVTPYDEPGSSITKARIQKDTKLVVTNDAPITVAGQGVGLQFDAAQDSSQTRQVWFVYNGNIYQAEVWITDQFLMKGILESWKFQ